ncbi:hypothetical protein HK100_001130 [Physocladia obscura]|uniref:Thioredoxin domain-containing protein n=1 Tax=Physocladia obscura TaxID=109957 RepID=A0AAD5SXJ8_9FUNG|nr:hypothetical protein HK100_001130 [Physocladia obscura]
MGVLSTILLLAKNVAIVFLVVLIVNLILPFVSTFLYPPKLGVSVAPISGLKFIKGASCPVPTPKKVTVIEIWATWCGPCVRTIPHLSQIANRFKDSVSFVGITQESLNDEAKIVAFVEKMGDKMDYCVAIDGLGESRVVMKDSAGLGIPHVIVIGADGKMKWAGHPMKAAFVDAVVKAVNEQ